MPSSPFETGSGKHRNKKTQVKADPLDENDLEVRVLTFDELVSRFSKYAALDRDTALAMARFIRDVAEFDPEWIRKLR